MSGKKESRGSIGFFMIFVLDTSAVSDPRIRDRTGSPTTEIAIKKITSMISQLRTGVGVIFYTTPLVLNEMRRYLLSNNVSSTVFNELSSWLIIKSPDKFNIHIPAALISEYIEELRRRMYKGLRAAEEALKQAYKQEKELSEIIRQLREKYREALRKGIIDSPEDLDAILLAYEQKGVLVTNDEGIRKMAVKLGVITIDPLYFIESLDRMMEITKKN